MKKAVALYRISTEKQEISKLGLKSQESAVRVFAIENNYLIEKEFVEMGSGGNTCCYQEDGCC